MVSFAQKSKLRAKTNIPLLNDLFKVILLRKVLTYDTIDENEN